MVLDGFNFEEETAFSLLVRLGQSDLFLTSNLKSLDSVISLSRGNIYEFDGEIGSGKTQICYSIIVKFLSTKKSGRIGWISIIPLRTDLLQKHFRDKPDLDRLVCKNPDNIPELISCLDRYIEIQSTYCVQLLFIENIDALLHDTVYKGEIGRHLQYEVVSRLKRLAKLDVTVIVTNHITHWRGYPAPALGEFWSSQISNRFFVERPNLDSHVRSVSKLKTGIGNVLVSANFLITDKGLKDVN